jgi:undecaprenyl-diphosphatase
VPVRRAFLGAYAWLRRADLFVLLAVLAGVVGLWVYLALADEVREGGTQSLDERILLALRRPDNLAEPVGPPWLHEAGRDVTALGGITVLTLLTAVVIGFLIICRRRGAVCLVLIAVGGGELLSLGLKGWVERPRPSVVPHLSYVYTSSFPSGHSMNAAIIYLTLGSLLARLTPHMAAKIYFLCVALLLTGLVGVSRVYMGVHYPTDVLAGWAAGLVWAVLCWLTARYLQHRGAVERSLE